MKKPTIFRNLALTAIILLLLSPLIGVVAASWQVNDNWQVNSNWQIDYAETPETPIYLLWTDFIAGIFSQFWSYVALASLIPLCTAGMIVLMAREGHFDIKLIGMMIGLSVGLVTVVIVLGITNNAVQI